MVPEAWVDREDKIACIRKSRMMTGSLKQYSAELKAKIALDAIRVNKTTNEIAAEYGVHCTQIAQWKKQALDGLLRGKFPSP